MKLLIKLGSVSFLNAQPLTYAIENNMIEHEFTLIQTPPSELSLKLHKREIDLGLIPVAELLKRKEYYVVPEISISSYGEVDSVVVIAKKDINELSRVAVDIRSQSSTALLRIVLQIFHGTNTELIPTDIDKEDFLDGVDGAMLIGDSGLKKFYDMDTQYRIYDLGEIWTQETGLPFVYAVFAGHKDVILGRNMQALVESKNYGLGIADKISEEESRNLGIDYDICYKYLTERIKYDLGEKEIKGIIKYSQLLEELGEAQKVDHINLYTA